MGLFGAIFLEFFFVVDKIGNLFTLNVAILAPKFEKMFKINLVFSDSLISYQEPTYGYLMLMTEYEKLWGIIPKKHNFFSKIANF